MSAALVMLFVLLPISTYAHSEFKLPSGNSIIAETIAFAVENIGFEESSCFYVSYSSISSESAYRQASIIDDFLRRMTQNLPVSVDNIDNFVKTGTKKKKFTLVLVDSMEAFGRLEPALVARQYDTKGKHLIVISQIFDMHKTNQVIQKICEEFFNHYIVNVELIVRNATTGLMEFYTFFPVSASYCFEVHPVLHNTFNGRQLSTDLSLFPRKFDNFFGCPLSVVTFPFPPHVFLKHHKDGIHASGIDIKVLYGIANKLNFSVMFIDAQERGVLYPNGTMTGAINVLIQNKANITLGGYGSAAKVMLMFSPSVAYLNSAMVFAIPPLQEYSPLERLLLPFEASVWYAIGLTFGVTLVASVVLTVWNKSYRDLVFGSTVRYPVFEMIVVYLGGAINRFPNGDIARNVILQWLIVSLVLSSCYKAILFGMLKSGFLKKFPSTVEGMLDEGFIVDVPISLMLNLKEGPLGGRDSFALLKYNIHKHYAILQTGTSKRMVVDTNIQLQHFNSIFYQNGILRALPQRLFIFPMYFYYRKESFLVDPFDGVLTRFIQSGLIGFWRQSVVNVDRLRKTDTGNAIPLVINNFQSCFALCGVLIGCSIVIFILEILSTRIKRMKRILLCLHALDAK